MKVFRIVLQKFGETPRDAFSGTSGFSTDGRWHSKGRFLDYAAESRSLATLERLVHYKRFDHLAPHVIFEVEMPDSLIQTLSGIPAGWDGTDLLPVAQALGNAWCDRAAGPALKVPSAVTPGEHHLMLNSRHPAWDWSWVVSGPSPFEFDARRAELLKAET